MTYTDRNRKNLVDNLELPCYTAGMFIRQITIRRHGKQYTYHRLIESVRTPSGPRQRLVMSLGRLEVPRSQWRLLAERIQEFLYNQQSLPFGSYEVDGLARQVAERVERKRQRGARQAHFGRRAVEVYPELSDASQLRQLGPEYVGQAFYRRLGLEEMLQQLGFSEKQRALAEVEVVGRLVEPRSELGTVSWYGRSALGELMEGQLGASIQEDDLYRISDKLYARRRQIEEALWERERTLFSLKETIVLYDLTSTYFEGLAVACPKAKRGHSRDHRNDCLQVVLGLVLDGQGYAKAHEVFEGNRPDAATLEEMLERLEANSPEPGATVVMDRGLATKENLKLLRSRGYQYVVAMRAREREKLWGEGETDEWVPFRQSEKGEVLVEGRMKRQGEEILILCHSASREGKDRGIRERLRARLEEDAGKLKRRVQEGKLKDPAKIQQAIGRLRQRYPRVARLYRLELTAEGQVEWEALVEKLSEVEEADGRYLLRTNRTDLDERQIWELYIMLNRVERSFRSVKGTLGIRPIHHHKAQRVESHIFISVLAYHLLHAIEERLRLDGDTRSWATIRDILSTHQVVTITHHGTDGRTYEVRRPSRPEYAHEQIYKRLGLRSTPRLRQDKRSDNKPG
ncbi:MAG: IS1634 family transposase [Candidatus Latescibacterota bacterium]